MIFMECKSYAYLYATALHITLLLDSKTRGGPVWRLFSRFPTLWDEEPGEASLAILARLMAKDPIRGDAKHASDMYTLATIHRGVIERLIEDERGPPAGPFNQGQSAVVDEVSVPVTRDPFQ